MQKINQVHQMTRLKKLGVQALYVRGKKNRPKIVIVLWLGLKAQEFVQVAGWNIRWFERQMMNVRRLIELGLDIWMKECDDCWIHHNKKRALRMRSDERMQEEVLPNLSSYGIRDRVPESVGTTFLMIEAKQMMGNDVTVMDDPLIQ